MPSNTGVGEALLMNNGSRDTSHSDIQKLQQQLQDIKEQVRVSLASRFVMRRFNETNNFVYAERSSVAPCVVQLRLALGKPGYVFLAAKFSVFLRCAL